MVAQRITLYFSGSLLQGQTGKTTHKKMPVRENTGYLEMLSKRKILFAQVVNSLMVKVQEIAIFAAKKIINIFKKLDVSAKSVLCI